jgi:hypothetical protein
MMQDKLPDQLISSLNDRITRLERRNRGLTCVAAVSVIGLVILVAAGAMPSQVADKVEAKQFVLRSPQGKVLAELGADPFDGQPSLELFDDHGQIRVKLGVKGLSICNNGRDGQADLNTRIALLQDTSGDYVLRFLDDQGRVRLQAGVNKHDAPAIELWDKKRGARIKMSLDPESDEPTFSVGVPKVVK